MFCNLEYMFLIREYLLITSFFKAIDIFNPGYNFGNFYYYSKTEIFGKNILVKIKLNFYLQICTTLAGCTSVAQQAHHWYRWGQKYRFSRLRPLHPLCICVNRNGKILLFTHIHNSNNYNYCTRNDDHLILLLWTGNAYKEKILLQNTINTFNKSKGEGLNHTPNDGRG